MAITLEDCKLTKRKTAGRFLARYFRERSSGRLSKLLRSRALLMRDAVAAASVQVHAVGVGPKLVEGKPTKDWCIRLYVLQKLPPSVLGKSLLPKTVAGIPTDIVELAPAYLKANGPESCSANRMTEIRPAVPGISIGHFAVTGGTIGCFCRSTKAGDPPDQRFLLSNSHVLAPPKLSRPGDAVLQPSRLDHGDEPQRVAGLSRAIEIKIGDKERNEVDAAIALIDAGVEWNPNVCAIGTLQGVIEAGRGKTVRMHGRTTAMCVGIIDDIAHDPVVGLNPQRREVVARFEDQLKISPMQPSLKFGDGGDSGSLVVDGQTPNAVGLYFAGSDDGSYGLASPITRVMQELEIELI